MAPRPPESEAISTWRCSRRTPRLSAADSLRRPRRQPKSRRRSPWTLRSVLGRAVPTPVVVVSSFAKAEALGPSSMRDCEYLPAKSARDPKRTPALARFALNSAPRSAQAAADLRLASVGHSWDRTHRYAPRERSLVRTQPRPFRQRSCGSRWCLNAHSASALIRDAGDLASLCPRHERAEADDLAASHRVQPRLLGVDTDVASPSPPSELAQRQNSIAEVLRPLHTNLDVLPGRTEFIPELAKALSTAVNALHVQEAARRLELEVGCEGVEYSLEIPMAERLDAAPNDLEVLLRRHSGVAQ